jgi:hypothetical protein
MMYMSQQVDLVMTASGGEFRTRKLRVTPLVTKLVPGHATFDTRCMAITVGLDNRNISIEELANHVWSNVLRVEHRQYRFSGIVKGYIPAHLIKTDGVSLCIIFRNRVGHAKRTSRKRNAAEGATQSAMKRLVTDEQVVEVPVTATKEAEGADEHKKNKKKKKREFKYISEYDMNEVCFSFFVAEPLKVSYFLLCYVPVGSEEEVVL